MSEQLTIFETFNEIKIHEQPENKELDSIENEVVEPEPDEEIYIGQKVKIRLPEDKESEEYYYLKYYATPHLTKAGEISSITIAENGKTVCDVEFNGDKFKFHIDGLILL